MIIRMASTHIKSYWNASLAPDTQIHHKMSRNVPEADSIHLVIQRIKGDKNKMKGWRAECMELRVTF